MPCGMLSGSALKVLAAVAMILSHFAYAVLRFLPAGNTLLFTLGDTVVTPAIVCMATARLFGAPVLFFLLAEGLRHTYCRQRYLMRLFLLAVISEVPFRLALYGSLHAPCCNTVFLLFLAALFVTALDVDDIPEGWRLVAAVVSVAGVWLLRPDAGYVGMAAVVLFYYGGRRFYASAPVLALMTFPVMSLLSLFTVSLYDGTRGFAKARAWKLAFYLFYPAHLMALYAVRCVVGV